MPFELDSFSPGISTRFQTSAGFHSTSLSRQMMCIHDLSVFRIATALAEVHPDVDNFFDSSLFGSEESDDGETAKGAVGQVFGWSWHQYKSSKQ